VFPFSLLCVLTARVFLFIAVYVYRLALEYARLWADDREAMSYTP
jgi:hypothetical protein